MRRFTRGRLKQPTPAQGVGGLMPLRTITSTRAPLTASPLTASPLTLATLITATLCLAPTAAQEAAASPWILPPGTLVVSGRYDYAMASQEFLADTGTLQAFPLRGRYIANAYTLGARLGLSERFELEMSLPMKVVSFRSDPVILQQSAGVGVEAFDDYQDSIISFNQSEVGLGDLSVTSRFSLTTHPIATSIEVSLSAPTGYQPPEGTFGSKPSSADEFAARAGEVARPENIRDDVTLGDGVFSFTPTFHMGIGSSFGFFTRASLGFRLRNQGAGDQLVSEAKVGYFLTPWMLVYGGVYHELTVSKGRVIGISVAADDPTLPAREYTGTNNLKLIQVTLDRDLLATPVGLLLKPLPMVDLTLTYSPILSGRNVAKSSSVSVGVNIVSSY
jgi:hypothetical protein